MRQKTFQKENNQKKHKMCLTALLRRNDTVSQDRVIRVLPDTRDHRDHRPLNDTFTMSAASLKVEAQHAGAVPWTVRRQIPMGFYRDSIVILSFSYRSHVLKPILKAKRKSCRTTSFEDH